MPRYLGIGLAVQGDRDLVELAPGRYPRWRMRLVDRHAEDQRIEPKAWAPTSTPRSRNTPARANACTTLPVAVSIGGTPLRAASAPAGDDVAPARAAPTSPLAGARCGRAAWRPKPRYLSFLRRHGCVRTSIHAPDGALHRLAADLQHRVILQAVKEVAVGVLDAQRQALHGVTRKMSFLAVTGGYWRAAHKPGEGYPEKYLSRGSKR